jgi:S-adenosylmethionine/arginine decarboxylase-like enzyme
MNNYWGYHMLINCQSCDIKQITNKQVLTYFIKDLVDSIKMVAYGEPIIEHFATHDPDKAGYSVVQLIETSSITCHFVDKNGDGYIDVFSCMPYDEHRVLDVINKHFWPHAMLTMSVDRQAGKKFVIYDED